MFGCMEEEGKEKKISFIWLKWKWGNKKRGMEKGFCEFTIFFFNYSNTL